MNDSGKSKIMVVDDERHLLISVRDYLVSEGFDVILARSGEEALEQLEKVSPDLILLDISMPGMGGVGFLKRISSPEGKTSHPVLVLTARATMKEFFDTVEVDGFLGKPCPEAVLLRKIKEIIGRKKVVMEKQERVRKRILLAEDDVGRAGLIQKMVETAGHDIEVVKSGPEVLERVSVFKPDVILMKEILPRLNGSAVASLIQVMPSLNLTPVVLYDESCQNEEEASARYSRIKCIKKFVADADPDNLFKAVYRFL